MLLFILYCLLCRRPVADFNTSHVTVYHDPSFYYRIYEAFQYISCYCLSVHSPPRLVGILISIHLMLLFINNETAQVAQEILFQYISCYCLSLQILSRFTLSVRFQYISCYCLSRWLVLCRFKSLISIHLMLLFICKGWENARGCKIFQYISCYCLSEKVATLLLRKQCISIHLMLLFIMLLFAYRCASGQNFNTSHVTVYRNQPLFSILPMQFQYISCYCLSIAHDLYRCGLVISIHLMLLFILVLQKPLYQICIISIHLMLLFI